MGLTQIFDEKYFVQALVLYKSWSHQNCLKVPQTTWELAFYKWKPSLAIVQMLDREQNYHDGKRMSQESRDAKTKQTSEAADDTDPSTYSTTTPTHDNFDASDSQTAADFVFEASASIRAYFELTKNIYPRNTPRTDADLASADDLSAQLCESLSPNNTDVSKWTFDEDSIVSPQLNPMNTGINVTASSVLLATAFSDSIPALDTLRTYKEHYTVKNVPVLSLPMETIARVHKLNERQRIVFEIGAATLLRAHIWGLDITTIPISDTSTEPERRRIAKLNAILNGEQQTLLFQSGCAGTGKSVTIHAIKHFAQSWGIDSRIAVTAPTGSAALGINGTTLHTFAGFNILLKSKKDNTLPSIAQLALLIIDEISFVSCNLLNALDVQLQKRTRSQLQFGGISIIFSGDMGQLAPVSNDARQVPLYHMFQLHTTDETQNSNASNASFCGAKLWQSITNVVELTYNYRAETDPLFIDFLGRVREGEPIAQQHLDALIKRRISPELLLTNAPPLGTSMVWRTNQDVNAANSINVHRNGRCLGRTVYRFPAAVIENEKSGGSGAQLHHTSAIHNSSYLIGIVNSRNVKDLPIALLDLYIGASVTIQRNNKLLKHGVANGSEATFVGTYPPLDQLPTTLLEVTLSNYTTTSVALVETMPQYFLFHIRQANFKFANLPPQVLPMAPHSHNIIRVHSQLSQYTYNVSQVQVRLFGATTVHTSQGKTNSPNFIGNLRKDPGFNYVALSRGTSFANTYIGSHVKLQLSTFDKVLSHDLQIQLFREKQYSNLFVQQYMQRTKDI